MSTKVVTWVFHESASTGNPRLVLLAIADEADDDGASAYPSIKRIADKARVNERTCLRAIEALEALGELEVTRPETRGRGRFNNYRVLMGKGDNLAPFAEPEKVRNGDNARRGKVRNGAPVVPDRVVDPLTLIDPTTLSRASNGYPDAFERFWQTYPRRTGKRAAFKEWERAKKRTSEAAILDGARLYAEVVSSTKTETKYVKHPERWLRSDGWLDEYDDPNEEPRVVEY